MSIRIFNPQVQSKVFEKLGLSPEEARELNLDSSLMHLNMVHRLTEDLHLELTDGLW